MVNNIQKWINLKKKCEKLVKEQPPRIIIKHQRESNGYHIDYTRTQIWE